MLITAMFKILFSLYRSLIYIHITLYWIHFTIRPAHKYAEQALSRPPSPMKMTDEQINT